MGNNDEADKLQQQIDANNAALEVKREQLADTRMQIIKDSASGGWQQANNGTAPVQGTLNNGNGN